MKISPLQVILDFEFETAQRRSLFKPKSEIQKGRSYCARQPLSID
jgi:hypothetical protein